MTICPHCGGSVHGIMYAHGQKYSYEGISEWKCVNCNYREGFFCKHELHDYEKEPVECDGTHPIVIEL